MVVVLGTPNISLLAIDGWYSWCGSEPHPMAVASGDAMYTKVPLRPPVEESLVRFLSWLNWYKIWHLSGLKPNKTVGETTSLKSQPMCFLAKSEVLDGLQPFPSWIYDTPGTEPLQFSQESLLNFKSPAVTFGHQKLLGSGWCTLNHQI